MPARTFADEPGLVAGADVSSEVVTVNDTCNIRSACDLCSNKLQYTYLRRFRRVSILGCIFLSTVRALWFLLIFGSGRFGLPLAIFWPFNVQDHRLIFRRKLTYSFTDASPLSFSFPCALEADLDFFAWKRVGEYYANNEWSLENYSPFYHRHFPLSSRLSCIFLRGKSPWLDSSPVYLHGSLLRGSLNYHLLCQHRRRIETISLYVQMWPFQKNGEREDK